MTKNTNEADMLTFEPFGEKTLIENEKINKSKNIAQKDVKKIVKNKTISSSKKNTPPNSILNGIILGFVITGLFICYDIFLH